VKILGHVFDSQLTSTSPQTILTATLTTATLCRLHLVYRATVAATIATSVSWTDEEGVQTVTWGGSYNANEVNNLGPLDFRAIVGTVSITMAASAIPAFASAVLEDVMGR